MSTVKRIVCLANSRKLSGRCIAGKEIISSKAAGWIRPVSAREHEEVSERERQYPDGSDPRILDVIDVPLLKPIPRDFQRENWLLDTEHYWKKVGRMEFTRLTEFTEKAEFLWVNGNNTYHGLNDKIPLSLAKSLESSLCLIQVDRVQLSVFKPGKAFNDPKRRVQGRFKYNNVVYKLWVTDPSIERAYLAKPDGNYEIEESYLTISLGEAFNDACYKLIASIIHCKSGG
ncbi:MAG: hypothetical protein A4E66_00628 [Syntrophus sp. PtaB.Bin001]|nr:MAG: hypothetical protein A4E66_00628 [Syntrophus sp. PtaB.Bin001]